jgi:hypothetical protein
MVEEVVHSEKVVLPPATALFVVFEGDPPEGAFMTAFSTREGAESFCQARSKRFATYWREYRIVVDEVVVPPVITIPAG